MENTKHSENAQIQIQERFSRNTADSDHFRNSQYDESCIQKYEGQSTFGQAVFQKICAYQIYQPEITSSVHRGAISWLIKACWARNYHDDVLWSSIAFYYAYKSSFLIQKTRLVMTLSTCLYLSAKLHSSQSSMSISNILQFGDSTWAAADIQKIQSDILHLIDFQPFFQSPLCQLLTPDADGLNFKVLFLVQVLMFDSFEPVFNPLFRQEIRLVGQHPGLNNSAKEKILSILKNKKQTDCLIKKHTSRFDVQEFVQWLRQKEVN